MKTILRETLFYSLSLYLLSRVFDGVSVQGDIKILLIAGLVLAILSVTVKPVLQVLTFPFSILTAGLFSIVITALLLYLLTVVVTQVHISGFVLDRFTLLGITVPRLVLNDFFAYMVTAIGLSGIMSVLSWLTAKK